MATVTGKTSERIDELLGETLVGANLNSQGALTFVRKNGSTINAGSMGAGIVNATINAAKHLILTTMKGDVLDAGSIEVSTPLNAWPVGAIYIGVTSANPATLLGGGTWERFAKGRVLVGLDEADANFDAVQETGGAKTADVPGHAHTMAHTHEHPHKHDLPTNNNDQLGGTASRVTSGTTGAASEETTSGSSAPNTGTAGAATVSVVQPYITVYMWRRTA